MAVLPWVVSLVVSLTTSLALAQPEPPAQPALPEAREPQVFSTWQSAGVTTLDRSVPLAFEPAPLPIFWISPRLGLGHFPFSWVDAGVGITLRMSDYVRAEGNFDYAFMTLPERSWGDRLHFEGALGVLLWRRQAVTRWRYALTAHRPQSQYPSTKLKFVELDLPNHESLYLEGGFISDTLGYRPCSGEPCVADDMAKLRGAWVHHLRAGARFSRLTWARLDNGDSVRSTIDIIAYALLHVGTLPSAAVFDAPAFQVRTIREDPAPIGGEVHVRYTPWYYQWVSVELTLGYLPGPRATEFRLGFSLPLWLTPWEGDQFDVHTGGKSIAD